MSRELRDPLGVSENDRFSLGVAGLGARGAVRAKPMWSAKAFGGRVLSLRMPPRLVLAPQFDLAKKRLEEHYKNLGWSVLKTPAHEDARLDVPDVLFLAERQGRMLVVVLLEQNEPLARLSHLERFREQRGSELRVHVHQMWSERHSLGGLVGWGLKQNWLMTAFAVPLISAAGLFAISLIRSVPTSTVSSGTHALMSPPETAPKPAQDGPPPPASSPTLPQGAVPALTTGRTSAPIPYAAPAPVPRPDGASTAHTDDDASLPADLQVHLRQLIGSDDALRGLPVPTLILHSPPQTTYRDEVADCTLDARVNAGTRILVAQQSFRGSSATGDTVDALIRNACRAAVEVIVKTYHSH